MTYGHAERTLAAICLLESETKSLLNGLHQLNPEQAQWLDDVDTAKSAARRRQASDVAPPIRDSP
jgi:hypothetical protein